MIVWFLQNTQMSVFKGFLLLLTNTQHLYCYMRVAVLL